MPQRSIPTRRADRHARPEGVGPRYGVARVLSKRGLASRTQAAEWVREGLVHVNGVIVRDPEFPVVQGRDRIAVRGQGHRQGCVAVDGQDAGNPVRLVVMLNKPRGLVTTARDEQGRDTVYRCFAEANLPWLAPVGRLDKASEGLLLFSNDPAWSAGITNPLSGPDKTYHVQIDRVADPPLLAALHRGVTVDGEHLRVKAVHRLRAGDNNSWLEIVLDQGRNRQIRRMLKACDASVARLVRVAIGALELADLPKGGWRALTPREVNALTGSTVG